MVRCECDRMVDTDYDVEGLFEDTKPWRFWCASCIENAVKSDNKALLVALKAQEPDRYKELHDD